MSADSRTEGIEDTIHLPREESFARAREEPRRIGPYRAGRSCSAKAEWARSGSPSSSSRSGAGWR